MAELTKGLKKFFEFIKTKNEGDLVTADEIMRATDWKESSLVTYQKKHKLAGFVSKRSDGRFEVLRDGASIDAADVSGALTQVTPDVVRFMSGERLTGSNGEYELESERGRGATAHVWTALNKATGERVAVKIVNPRPDLLAPSVFRDLQRRFRREGGNGRGLTSEYLIRHLDVGTYRNLPFIVMELAERSLKDVLDMSGPMQEEEANRCVGRCLVGLHHLHLIKCIHRDVKPANMLLTRRGVVLGDLGIVKWSDLNPDFISAGTITTAAVNLGSLNYMAPEQRDAPKDVDSSSDVYALGVSWYELLTNQRPSPQAFTAGRVKLPSGNVKLNELIVAMTRYERTERPTIKELLSYLQIELEMPGDRVSA